MADAGDESALELRQLLQFAWQCNQRFTQINSESQLGLQSSQSNLSPQSKVGVITVDAQSNKLAQSVATNLKAKGFDVSAANSVLVFRADEFKYLFGSDAGRQVFKTMILDIARQIDTSGQDLTLTYNLDSPEQFNELSKFYKDLGCDVSRDGNTVTVSPGKDFTSQPQNKFKRPSILRKEGERARHASETQPERTETKKLKRTQKLEKATKQK